MGEQVRIGVVGLGKMGLSHFAMVDAHPDTETCASDSSESPVGLADKHLPAKLFPSCEAMLNEARPHAVVIATPSRLHASMVRAALERGVHVFCEKPFCLEPADSEALAELAAACGLVERGGLHDRSVGAVRQMKQVVDSGAPGRITHVQAEAYGPVVLRPKRQSWRTRKSEGGGCLHDGAAHPRNLLNWLFGTPERISGSAPIRVFSTDIDDQVLSTPQFPDGTVAQLSVSWSDGSHRKMTTRITLIDTNGRLYADQLACQICLRQPAGGLADVRKGWTVNDTTDLTEDPSFLLRGEQYSARTGAFVAAVRDGTRRATENDFASAAVTDRRLAMILADAAAAPRKRGWFGGPERHAEVLRTRQVRVNAMPVFASGAIPAEDAIASVAEQPNPQSVFFGTSSGGPIREPVERCGAPVRL